MKNSFIILCFLSIILSLRNNALAQNSKEFDVMKDDIESMLPPLEAMIDSAIAHNPYVNFRDLQIAINEYKLKADRSQWVRNLGVQADVRYGTFDNFSTNTAEGQTPSLLSTSSNQFNYGVGSYIKIPLYDIVNRKNQIRLAKAEVEQAQSFSLVQRNELRQLVIKQYNEVIVKQRILKIKSKYAETSNINLEIVEKEFLKGVVSITEYSRISEIHSRSQSDLENAKMDFKTAYMILEEIAGYQFNFIKN